LLKSPRMSSDDDVVVPGPAAPAEPDAADDDVVIPNEPADAGAPRGARQRAPRDLPRSGCVGAWIVGIPDTVDCASASADSPGAPALRRVVGFADVRWDIADPTPGSPRGTIARWA